MSTETKTPAPRLPLQMDVNFRKSYGRSDKAGILKNISLTGAFLCTNDPELGPRDKLVIKLQVGGREREIQASVIWHNDAGCGVKFLPFNNRDVQIVDDLMYFVENRRESRRTILEDIFKRVA